MEKQKNRSLLVSKNKEDFQLFVHEIRYKKALKYCKSWLPERQWLQNIGVDFSQYDNEIKFKKYWNDLKFS